MEEKKLQSKILETIIKILLLATILILIQVLLNYFFTSKNTSQTINDLEQNNIPVSKILTENDKETIRDYLKDNISQLSPEKEVLGGKFYITDIQFVDNNNLIVDYEDGHIAFKAKIKFEVDYSGGVNIVNFEISKF